MNRGLFSSAFLLFLIASIAFGQAISGNLVGNVVDTTGGSVANARIEILNTLTNSKTSDVANAKGEYRFNNLPAGSYNLIASAAGFTSANRNGVVVDVTKTVTVNITLQVGAIASAVEVAEAGATIDTTTATIGSSFSAREARDLPVSSIGLGVLNLSLLNAGVASNGGLGVGRGPSVGGQRPRNNNFTIEGVDNNNKSVTGALITIPNDAVAEFTLQQNQFSAEFGHSSGGQFNTIVKSGTNELHGSAYEYLQNRNLNAQDQLFVNAGIRTNPRFDANRFGGTAGGPIRKNKLFYFGNYEFANNGQNSTVGGAETPTANGFATLASIAGLNATNLGVLKQYATAAPVALPAARFPLVTNAQGSPIPIEVGALGVAAPNYVNNYSAVATGDYNVSEKDQVRLRYVFNRIAQLDHAANLPAFYQITAQNDHLATVSEYHNFSAAMTNEFRLGFSRYVSDTPAGDYKFPGLDSFPNLQFSDLGGLQLGPNPNAPQSASSNVYQLIDNLSWTKGAHTLQFGWEGRKYIAPTSFTQRSRGDYQYSNLDSFLHDISPDRVAQRGLGNAKYYGDQIATYAYANDVWRIRRNLTLNLGLRYEFTTVPYGERSQILNAISNVPGLLTFGEPQPQKKNFAPRIGIAYSPGKDGRTSIRAGFGMAYDVIYDNIGTLALPPQFSTTSDVSGANIPNFLANGGILPSSPGGPALTAAQARANTAAYIPDQKLPHSIQWNFGVQRVLGQNYTLDVRYLGTRGINLNVQSRINKLAVITPQNALPTYFQAPSQATLDALPNNLTTLNLVSNLEPAFANAGFTNSAFVEDGPFGNSTYHGLAVQLSRRFTQNLHLQAAYTWSHLIDDSTADFNTTALTPRRPQDFQNLRVERSSSALDRRQRLSLSAVYDAPWFRNSNPVLKNVLGNWSIAPIYIYESPEYATPQSGIDSNLNGDSATDRTIVNPSGLEGTGSGVRALTNSSGNIVAYLALNPTAKYIVAGRGAYATGGRNTLAGRPIDNFDLNLSKSFSWRERYKLQFSAQFFNTLNHAQFVPGFVDRVDNPAVLNTGGNVVNYLTPGNAIFNNPEAIYSSNPRAIQLALKILF